MAARKRAPKDEAKSEAAGPRRVEPQARIHRIVEAAVALAEAEGFAGVRTRDICVRAGVSMSALYRVFDSKEEILLRAFAEDLLLLEGHVARRPIEGATPKARVLVFLSLATTAFLARPGYARAVIAAMGSGQHRSLAQLAAVESRMTRLIDGAIRGPGDALARDPEDPLRAAIILHRVWFGLLVGWAASVYSTEQVLHELEATTDFVMQDRRPDPTRRARRSVEGA